MAGVRIRGVRTWMVAAVVALGTVHLDASRVSAQTHEPVSKDTLGIVYRGPKKTMTFHDFAAYCAPAVWFSPNEPLLEIQEDGQFQLPLPLPFEEPTDKSVVYFRLSKVVGRADAESKELWTTAPKKEDYILHLDRISRVTLHFFFYYDRETGVGAHPHDFETTEFSVEVSREGNTTTLKVTEVIAHAHGIPWYFNVLDVKNAPDVVFPVTIIVEEGKHGNCTDRNSDGFYSPGYDVTKRANDAWGVRDIMAVGVVITPNYQTWMTKIRLRPSRIAPPLPEDSYWYNRFTHHYYLAEPNKRQYVLRPVPDIRQVDFSPIEHGEHLKHFIETKGYPEWPVGVEGSVAEDLRAELFDESFLGSWGYGYRYDGISSLTVTFPLLLVRNFEVPFVGGWMVQRIYVNLGVFSSDFKIWGHQFTYTPSASRWVDWYAGAGYEIRDVGSDDERTEFVYEAGNKFRADVTHTGLKFLRYLGSDFWGLRLGLRAVGFPEIEELGFLVEVGAGVW